MTEQIPKYDWTQKSEKIEISHTFVPTELFKNICDIEIIYLKGLKYSQQLID